MKACKSLKMCMFMASLLAGPAYYFAIMSLYAISSVKESPKHCTTPGHITVNAIFSDKEMRTVIWITYSKNMALYRRIGYKLKTKKSAVSIAYTFNRKS